MWLCNRRVFRCLILLLLSIYLPSAHGQNSITCDDLFVWCPSQNNSCSLSLIQEYCRKTCNTCPSDSPVCKAKDCKQRCILSEDLKSAKCGCFKGYRLQADGISCEDIDECAENPNICEGIAPKCVNKRGLYACSACIASDNSITNYYSDPFQCCKLNTASTCGKSASNKPGRIVNGKDASIMNWPWQVYIEIGGLLCGGSLITSQYVLTAGHCVGNQDLNKYTIVAGVFNTTNDGSIYKQNFKPKKIYRHPNYAFPNFDIAIIQLDRPANLNDYVNTICLPGGEEPTIGEMCYATGYGTTSFRGVSSQVLQEVALPIVNTTVCQETYKDQENKVFPDIQMCAGFTAGIKDTCQGDSGGPLVCQRCKNCDWYIAGIISFGRGCAQAGFYGVYTRVKAFEGWITGITNLPFTNNICIKPSWATWSSWSTCNAACGAQGTHKRTRSCQNGLAGDPGCVGLKSESSNCSSPPCVVFTQWSAYDSCTATCGGGSKTRNRACPVAGLCQPDQYGVSTSQTTSCNSEACPAEWGSWGEYGDCSLSCGGGTHSRSRSCIGAGNCVGSAIDQRLCNTEVCLKEQCARTTNLVPTFNCNYYALIGYCNVYKDYMDSNCVRSCCEKEQNIGIFHSDYCANLYSDQQCSFFQAPCHPDIAILCKKTCAQCIP